MSASAGRAFHGIDRLAADWYSGGAGGGDDVA
jgi:hypothetical protein